MTNKSNTDKMLTRSIHDSRMAVKTKREIESQVKDGSVTPAKARKLYRERTGKDW
jgi:hypothetical protein